MAECRASELKNDQDRQCWSEPKQSTYIEIAQGNATCLAHFAEQDRGYKISAEGKEHVDADPSSRHEGLVAMRRNNKRDCDSPQTIERRIVAHGYQSPRTV